MALNVFSSALFVLSFVIKPDKVKVLEDALDNENEGFSGSVKSNIPFPRDSTVFKIPSLSLSKSILSIIPSSSKSLGQILIGTSVDL